MMVSLRTARPDGRRTSWSQETADSVSDDILQRVAAGDTAAMQECMDRYGGLVWSLARRFSLSPADAEDGVQEVFIELWKHAARFNPEIASETTFVGMIARRRLIDRRRQSQTQQRIAQGVADDMPPTPPEGDEKAVEVSDEARRAAEAMKTLSEDQQRVLTLSITYGLTHQQISEQTGLALGTVKTHARRGLIRVREALAQDDNSPDAIGATS